MTAPSSAVDAFTEPALPASADAPWPLWQRVLLRFFCVYLLLQIAPWNWFSAIPPVEALGDLWSRLVDATVRLANDRLFHVAPTLVAVNGSGDTSWAWTQFRLYLLVAAVACLVWSVIDRHRTQYDRLAWWLRLVVRYYIATFALSYGIIKLFALQMAFPTLSQLSTPLGDFLPMRLSWMFIGYSFKYQFFSGLAETVAGLLLLYRRTVTAGLLAATGAFLNVVMINVSYDVPVKLFASHLLFACLFMLALDAPRLINFLVLNRATPATTAYDFPFTMGWQRWGARAVKVFIVVQVLVLPMWSGWTRYQAATGPQPTGPFPVGVYQVQRFVVNGTEVPYAMGDSLRWNDVIFDNSSAGSVGTRDPVFWQRYRRGYFRYAADSSKRLASVWKTSTIPGDSTFLFTMRYELRDSLHVQLHTMIRGDSVHAELARIPRHFQLAERQFHWISEYNR
jgi:multidrug transporter EmrE-like cation transporter